jgi:serine/threonine-protein kinase
MGEVFAGRFELLDPVAEGAMGSVWRVRDLRDGRVYAGKVLRQSDAGSLLRFMREQSTRVRHPHVVTPLSWAGEDDRVVFTMPLVTGGSVATLLGDHGALPDPWTVALLDQALQALEAVHAAGYVHRDVKPANLLLRPTGSGRLRTCCSPTSASRRRPTSRGSLAPPRPSGRRAMPRPNSWPAPIPTPVRTCTPPGWWV